MPNSLTALRLALLLAGQPLPCEGRLLTDPWHGRDVPVDPVTGAETSPWYGWWMLSDEGEATDGHIVRCEWDLRRAAGNINVLYDHGQESSPIGSFPVGAWEEFRVETGVPNTVGRSLLAKIRWAENIAQADTLRSLVDQRILRSVSVRWLPGASIRRGELDPADPLYREPIDGLCGPEEGMVMGTSDQPNELVEASLTPTPAQHRAYARAMVSRHARADQAAAAARAGKAVSEGDYEQLLARVAADPKVMAFLTRLVDQRVAARLGTRTAPTPSSAPTLHTLFQGR